jgi:tetratricopeptide (TPR) repeat protein
MERGLCHLLNYEERRYGQQDPAEDVLLRAQDDLTRSVALCTWCNRQELPKATHELGHVYWERGLVNDARAMWEQSVDSARDASNLRYILENEIGLCELDIDTGAYDAALLHRAEIANFFPETHESHRLLWSRLEKLEGEALLGLGRFDGAIGRFSNAIPELAMHGGWGRYRLDIELATLEAKLSALPRDRKAELLHRLALAWMAHLDEREIPPDRTAMVKAAVDRLTRAV